MRYALITGASSGIGEALARLLATKGYSLIIAGRDAERLQKVAREVNARKIVIADLGEREGRGELAHLIRTLAPELVINNAGFGIYGDILSTSVDEQLAILKVNGQAALELTLEAAHALKATSKPGVVVNVSSAAGEHPCPGMSVYAASKAFITHVSQAIHTELAPFGIHVLVSCPGMVATRFADRAAGRILSLKKTLVMTPEYAASQIWRQIEKKQEKRIFDWRYRLGSLVATHLIPLSWVKNIVWKQIKQRIR